MRGRELFAFSKPLLLSGSALLGLFPRGLAAALLVLLRNTPGHLGLGLRYICVARLAAACGENVAIYAGVHLHDLDRCRLGSNIKIGEMCFIGCSGRLTIEDDVSLAHGTSVLTEEHDHSAPGPLRETPLTFAPVHIERDVWIGAGVRVLAGVRIGRGTAVGAGSVVTRDLPGEVIAAGVPAKVLKSRAAQPPEGASS